MENRLYLYNLGIKTFGGFATLGGVIQALQLFTQPDLDIKSILLSFPAWVVYVFVCLTIIFAMLRERYKSMSQRVEVLNVKLNEQDAMIRSLQEMMKIVPFKGRFFLTTEYLYNELGEYIQNNIDIDSIEIKNTIEKRGMGNKRDSFVRLNIRGVVSYGKVKSPGSIVDLMIEWCWPNMLNITDCDYTTLPNFLAGTVKHLKMSLECKEDIGFKSASIYKYKVGMDKAQLILDVDMSEITDTISYEEDNPLMNSTYILYYEVAR